LSVATVLVEVPTAGRSLLAAHSAAATDRRGLALPGSVVSGTWTGCYELITTGVARMVTGPAAVLDELTSTDGGGEAAGQPDNDSAPPTAQPAG
jgi:predicted Rossmann fold nucleotide-binding protein DprA/Smf involved in DNA uptake